MAKKRRGRSPGLYLREGVWHIDKHYRDHGRVCESTRTGSLEEAEEYLAYRLAELRRVVLFGDRPRRVFRDAATKYLEEVEKRTVREDVRYIDYWLSYVGEMDLENIHDDTLAAGRDALVNAGRSAATVNHYLEVVRRILKLSARKWRDEKTGKTWLSEAPLITMFNKEKAHLVNKRLRAPRMQYPLGWDEQSRLLQWLPEHLKGPVEFALLTGMREREITGMRWAWLRYDGPGGLMYLLLPDSATKSGRTEVVALSSRARELVNAQHGRSKTFVWTWWLPQATVERRRYRRTERMNNTAWRKAWERAGLPVDRQIMRGVHNLRHTFATRLRALGVPLETRELLLRHASESLTTHYSHAQWNELIQAVERVVSAPEDAPMLELVRPIIRASGIE